MDTDINAPTQLNSDGAGTEPTNKFLDFVPEQYRQKEWVTNISKSADPWTALFNAHEGALGLVGKRAEGIQVPGETATPDDWNNFYKQIGVPETPDKYEYRAPEVSEKLKPYFQQDDDLLNAMKQAAVKAGVRPEGFKHLAEAFDQYYVSQLENTVNSAEQTLKKLDADFKARFGERSGAVLQNWQNSLNTNLSKEQAAIMAGLDPAVKVVLAEHYDKFASKYIREDNLNLDVPAHGSQMSQAEYGNEYAKLFAAVRQSKPGSAEHETATQKLAALRSRAADVFKA